MTTSIKLASIASGLLPRGKVAVFGSPEEAMAHLCDHLLTQDEVFAWAILRQDIVNIVAPEDDEALNEIATAMWRGDRLSEVQSLYDMYREEIEISILTSIERQWCWGEPSRDRKGNRFMGIGLNGVFWVWNNDTVVTAMLKVSRRKNTRKTVSYYDRQTNPRPRKKATKTIVSPFQEIPPIMKRYRIFRKCFVRVRNDYFNALSKQRSRTLPSSTCNLREDVPEHSEWAAMVMNKAEKDTQGHSNE